MARRVAIQKKPVDDGVPPSTAPKPAPDTPGEDTPGEIDFAAEPVAPAKAVTGYGAKDAGEIDAIIEGVISLSPRKLNESLTWSERVGSRDLSVIFKALDDEAGHVREAAQQAMIARRNFLRLQGDAAALKSRLYMEAVDKVSTGETAKGARKAPTDEERKCYYRTHPELIAMRGKVADYEAWSDHCATIARARVWHAKTLEELLGAARATGTGKTSGYGEDGSDKS